MKPDRSATFHQVLMESSIIVLFTLLSLAHTTLADSGHNLQAVADEEITIGSHDENYESQIAREENPDSKLNDRAGQPARDIYHNDPFSVTFEDYLREASRSSNGQKVDNEDEQATSAVTSTPNAAGLIIEDEENLIKTKESPVIDFIFPAPKQEPNRSKQDNTKQHDNDELDSKKVLSEIRLLFAWKQLATNKCSKSCGKGFKIVQLSCIDLKYGVRVEDELCLRSTLPAPNKTTDEPCNEVDCPPQWTSSEFQECNQLESQDGVCRTSTYKRVQCTMVNKNGVIVQLDDSRCSSDRSLATVQATIKTEEYNRIFANDAQVDEESVDIAVGSYQKNDILSINDEERASGSIEQDDSKLSGDFQQNEPFFEPGPWSECSGGPCGQLGKRTRKLTCRFFLSRSSKFVELPESRCHNAHRPDSHEPCYMDCQPENESETKSVTVYGFNNSDYNDDETLYDLDTRFNWREDGWTKCSAECLGGRRELILTCWDGVTEAAVESSLCDPRTRPKVIAEPCNDIPCAPEWKVDSFSACTRTCGSAGIRSRAVTCVQQVPSQDGQNFLVVSNDLCIQTNGSMPHRLEPCNRVDCRPEWSVGPWSECNRKCGVGVRNRTVICVQEFATKEGPKPNTMSIKPQRVLEADLLEAIMLSSKDWHPGKVTQIPFRECYEEYRTVPVLDEKCFNHCEREPFIDADIHQNYRSTPETIRKKTITLKVGGKAQVVEGRNLKIRCRLMNVQARGDLVKTVPASVEWHKDGVRIFSNGSTVAEKLYNTDDNSILGNDVLADENNIFLADEPSSTKNQRILMPRSQPRPKKLVARSWNNEQESGHQSEYNFVSQVGGRFSLVKENSLRIKKLRVDDSGTYTCSYGPLSESLDLAVISRRSSDDPREKLTNNLRT